jgi:uncharacterized protein (UPF0262 family)
MSDQKMVGIFLDERSVVSRSAQVDHERKVAIYDLIQENSFKLAGDFPGPYNLHLSIAENRLIFDVRDTGDNELTRFVQPLSSLRAVIKDYFMVCDSYYRAIKISTPSKIEAIDMGRRSLHNEGAKILQERLAKKVEIDTDTARRLFTLICVLHIRA